MAGFSYYELLLISAVSAIKKNQTKQIVLLLQNVILIWYLNNNSNLTYFLGN